MTAPDAPPGPRATTRWWLAYRRVRAAAALGLAGVTLAATPGFAAPPPTDPTAGWDPKMLTAYATSQHIATDQVPARITRDQTLAKEATRLAPHLNPHWSAG